MWPVIMSGPGLARSQDGEGNPKFPWDPPYPRLAQRFWALT